MDYDPADPLLAPLNDRQREAVLAPDGPLLILAGAGSGKTRVITHRVAWLVLRRGVAPWRILAVTFTNKAAAEMRERLERLLGPAGSGVHVSTFHSAGASILRREAQKVGLSRSFVIYDDADQLQLVRRALSDCGVGDKVRAQTVLHRIDQAKNHARLPDDLPAAPHDFIGLAVKRAYWAYQRLLRAADAVDFGDLLLLLVDLFKRDPETLDSWRRRFRHVLVDEFQDTNTVQYRLLRQLCPPGQANLCVVGDDDQSIYRWRGAEVANILSFPADFPGTSVVKLEQNYRSDANILGAAHAVIVKNLRRAEKRLWTEHEAGAPLETLQAADERGEAAEVARRARALRGQSVPWSEMAVLYRVNAQSRVLEEAMRLDGIPYHIVRGRAFYDRAEIKDAAAYLRLALNPRSDTDLERVINTPARGIGDVTVEKVKAFASAGGVSMSEALADPAAVPGLNAGAVKRLAGFRDLLRKLSERATRAADAGQAVEAVLDLSGLLEAHLADESEEGEERAGNLREFEGAAREFDRRQAEAAVAAVPLEQAAGPPGDPSSDPAALRPARSALEAFLEQISLTGDADASTPAGKVALMTLHAAKGLEFDVVFMTGMEEDVFPHSRATDTDAAMVEVGDGEEMAEERRLCYVGITRARKRLFVSLAASRSLYGEYQRNEPSRFLDDIPAELFAAGRATPSRGTQGRVPGEPFVEREDAMPDLDEGDGFDPDDFDQRPDWERRPPPKRLLNPAPFVVRRKGGEAPAVGASVVHEEFGEGLVVDASGSGGDAHLTVRFADGSERRIIARFVRKA